MKTNIVKTNLNEKREFTFNVQWTFSTFWSDCEKDNNICIVLHSLGKIARSADEKCKHRLTKVLIHNFQNWILYHWLAIFNRVWPTLKVLPYPWVNNPKQLTSFNYLLREILKLAFNRSTQRSNFTGKTNFQLTFDGTFL